MLKKFVLGGLAAALLGGVLLGTGVWSHVRTATNWVTQAAEDSIPLEWEIRRAKDMINDLEPEITVNAKRIALEKIKVAKLEKEVATASERLADARRDISRLKQDLEDGSEAYTYKGKTFTSSQVKDELARRFNAYKVSNETADSLNQMLVARQDTLRAAVDRMEAMLAAKNQLEIEIENLEAQLAAVRVAQTKSELALDDSALSRTRDLLNNISARIEVEREMTKVSVDYFGGIELDEQKSSDLLDEITSYLDGENVEGGSAEALAGIRFDSET